MGESGLIHGYQSTDTRCPFCGDSYGMRERLASGSVRYVCWCGARRIES